MTEEESKLNLELCNTVLEDSDFKTLYGVHKVEGAGRVTLDKTKGRRHIECKQNSVLLKEAKRLTKAGEIKFSMYMYNSNSQN